MPDNFLALLESEKPDIIAMLPQLNDWLTPERWWAVAYEVAKSPALQKVAQANPRSLINALKTIAKWGLDLDGEECFINVYGDEAVAQTMYKGLVRRAIEAGAVAHAVADVIKEGDDVKIVSGTRGRELIHTPAFGLKGGKRPIIGGYALFVLPNGTTDYELFELDDIERVKAAALRMARRRKPDAELSPAWKFFEGEQVKKSVLRRGLKRFRGRRDTAAGKLYNDIQNESDNFDLERVKQAEAADNDIQTPPPKDAALRKVQAELVPDDQTKAAAKAKSDAMEPIDAESESLILAAAKEAKLRISALNSILFEKFGLEDVGQIKRGQVADVLKAIGA